MKSNHWEEVAKHFHRISELTETEQLLALNQLQQEAPDHYAEVIQLLQEENSIHPALLTGVLAANQLSSQDQNLLGSLIGPYRLVKYLGGGGMGSVFLAERADGEFERQVALKLIRSDYQSEKSLARFRIERQILANLQHPNIAQLYDGGSHVDRLYFTMEYLTGDTLMDHCTKNKLSQTERLDLFETIAEAIAYAHQQLVLHMDIKPSNIIIDETGRVKIVDFGIAKILEETDPNPQTGFPFTLAYAAPEQIQKQNSSTATDIYALGILLYQLLSNQLPFDRTTLSTALSSSTATSDAVLQQAFQIPGPHQLQGDFYHISAKALQKENTARYSSVDQMLADLRASRNHYPISIRKHNTSYSLGRFFYRHRKTILTFFVLALALLATATFYTLQLQTQRNQARLEAEKNSQLVQLLTDMFESADPYQSQNDTLPVSFFLDQAVEELAQNKQVDPSLNADLTATLASVYNSLGNYPKADSLAQQALANYQQIADDPVASLGQGYQTLANIKYSLGDYLQADSLYQEALVSYAGDKDHLGEIAACYLSLGHLQIETGHYAQADSLYLLAYQYFDQVHLPPHEDLAAALHGRGNAHRKQKLFESSNNYYQQALAMQRILFNEPNTEIAYTLNHLASLYYDQFQYEEGIPYARNSFEQRLAIFGPSHIETIASQSNLTRFYNKAKRYEEALLMREELYQSTTTVFGDRLHPYVIGQAQAIAQLNANLGRWEIAAEKYKDLLEIVKELPYPYRLQYVLHQGYGNTLLQLGQFRQAEKNLRQALQLVEAGQQRILVGDEVTVRYDLAICLAQVNKPAESKVFMAEARKLLPNFPDLPRERISELMN